MNMTKFPNLLQSGKLIKDSDPYKLEFTYKQLSKISYKADEFAKTIQRKYDNSVKRLQELQYREFAAKCAFVYAKTNSFGFSSNENVNPDLMTKYKDMAWNDRVKTKRERREVEYNHIMHIKPEYMKSRYDADMIRSIVRWIRQEYLNLNVYSEELSIYEREKHLEELTVHITVFGAGKKYVYAVYIPELDLHKSF